jgi:hypothetical protein
MQITPKIKNKTSSYHDHGETSLSSHLLGAQDKWAAGHLQSPEA